jgi:hypothetical protein
LCAPVQARLESSQQRAQAAAADADGARQLLAEKELLLVAAAPANGDIGEDAVSVAVIVRQTLRTRAVCACNHHCLSCRADSSCHLVLTASEDLFWTENMLSAAPY